MRNDNDDQLLREIREWMARRSKSESLSALTGKGISIGVADRLVNGRYKNRPSDMLRKLLTDLLLEEKAS